MNTYGLFALFLQACVIHAAFSRCLNAGIGCNYNPNIGAIASPVSAGVAPALGLGYPGAVAEHGYPTSVGPLPGGYGYGAGLGGIGYGAGLGGIGYGGYGGCGDAYGGAGEGNVVVAGELLVAGATAVSGQVPITGVVRFGGDVLSGGTVTISGRCACDCIRTF